LIVGHLAAHHDASQNSPGEEHSCTWNFWPN